MRCLNKIQVIKANDDWGTYPLRSAPIITCLIRVFARITVLLGGMLDSGFLLV
jgi:hypothetical protein